MTINIHLSPVVQRVDNCIQWIGRYPLSISWNAVYYPLEKVILSLNNRSQVIVVIR